MTNANNETKRDLHADLAICERATKGPWMWDDSFGEGCLRDRRGFPVFSCGIDQSYYPVAGEPPEPEDQLFIAEAREGWPHAIRRAIEAEARVAELETKLKSVYERLYRIHNVISYAGGYGEQIDLWALATELSEIGAYINGGDAR